jgi:hypothetical protein
MRSKVHDIVSLNIFWIRMFLYRYLSLMVTGYLIRLLAIFQRHHFQYIGKTRIIGSYEFIGFCEDFSRRLQQIDLTMYEELFIKNRFVFIQCGDVPYMDKMAGEYAVPSIYQELKADGIGALMIYGFFSTSVFGRDLVTFGRQSRQPGISKIPNKKTYAWLTEHHFPEKICEWYRKSLLPKV